MMRRALVVIIATIGGLVLLANFHTSPGTTVGLAGGTSGTAPVATAPTTTPPAGAGPTGPTTPTTAAPTTTVPVTRTIDGPVVANPYGDVQVRVTFDGTRIVDIQPILLPIDRRRSQEISDYSEPRLRSEALRAQSARIELVSGASYTSDSYAESLQGAIDRADR
jgi:uncharacterized protein with FMN-binding domain